MTKKEVMENDQEKWWQCQQEIFGKHNGNYSEHLRQRMMKCFLMIVSTRTIRRLGL